jgi:predicted DNA-binding protein
MNMPARSHLSRMTIDIPEEDHKRLKALAAVLGKSMREIVMDWIHDHLYSSNTPNVETLKAIKQIENGENLVECKDVDDLFKKLGI